MPHCVLLMTFMAFSLLAACMPQAQESYVFDIGKLSRDDWRKIDAQCEYEARKATASANPGSFGSRSVKSFIFSA
jgi:hypothetical protein